MRLKDAIAIATACIKNNLALAGTNARDEEYLIPYLIGHPGVGKTTGLRNAVRDLDPTLEFYILSLAQYDPAELAGWNVPKEGEEVMVKYRPDWMPKEGTRGVLFVDELPQAPTACQNIGGQLIHERRVGPHKMPDGWTIVAAGNAARDRAGTNHTPTHVRGRLMFLDVDAAVDDVVPYFYKAGVDERVCGYLRFRPDMLSKFDADENSCPSPRSWDRVGTIMKLGLPKDQQTKAIAGTVGAVAANDFTGYLKLVDAVPDMELLFKDPDKVAVPKDPGVMYAVCASISARMTDKNAANCMKYLNRMGREDFTMFCLKDALMRDEKLIHSKSILDFMMAKGVDLTE
jgi:hypothetical protein